MTTGDQLMQAIAGRLEQPRDPDWRAEVRAAGVDPDEFFARAARLWDELLETMADEAREDT